MTTRIVTTHYRYKLLPKKRKAVATEVPAIVTVARETLGRVPRTEQRATVAPDSEAASGPAIVTPKRKVKPGNNHPDSAPALPAAGKKPAIVTAKPKRRPAGAAMELPTSRKPAMARRMRGE